MFEQLLDDFRRATESTMRLQQQMLDYWTRQWGQMPAPGSPAAQTPWSDQFQAFQKQWSASVLDLLKKHRETLDAQYDAGLRTIEDAFKLGEARDPDQLRRLTESLWRHSFDALKTVAEEQVKELETAGRKWIQATSGTFAGRT